MLRHAVASAVLILGALPSANAQRSTRLGLAVGGSLPVGKVAEVYATGPAYMIALATGPSDSHFGLRLDYSSNRLRGKNTAGAKNQSISVPALTANIIGTASLGYAKPYAIAGAGWYPLKEGGDAERENDFGISGGAGITFPFVVGSGFLEARYHYVYGRQSAQRFVPVLFGVYF